MEQQSEVEKHGGVKGQNEQKYLLSQNDRADKYEKNLKKLIYAKTYITLGFTWVGEAGTPSPKYVLYNEVLVNSYIKLSYLCCPLQTKHNNLKEMQIFFWCKLKEEKQSTIGIIFK